MQVLGISSSSNNIGFQARKVSVDPGELLRKAGLFFEVHGPDVRVMRNTGPDTDPAFVTRLENAARKPLKTNVKELQRRGHLR